MITYRDIKGFYSDAQADLLLDYAKRWMPCISVELGSFLGRSTSVLALAAREQGCQVYAVDLWRSTPETHPDAKGYPYADYADGSSFMPEFIRNMEAAGAMRFVQPVCERSDVAARLFDDNSVGLIHHDASHDRASVARDLRAWLPKLRPGGLWLHHDYELDGGRAIDGCGRLVRLGSVTTFSTLAAFEKRP